MRVKNSDDKKVYNLRNKSSLPINKKRSKSNSLWEPMLRLRNKHKNLKGERRYVSATKIANYMLKDPVLDWYKECLKSDNNNNTTGVKRVQKVDLQTLFDMGNMFEEKVIKDIRRLFPGKVKKTHTGAGQLDVKLTLDCMKRGVPFIEQATLYDTETCIFGYADLLIRSDYVNKLIKSKPIKNPFLKAPLLDGNYHYIVVDIKWTTIELCADGERLRNSDRIPAYKGQLAIYNLIMGKMQGYIPDNAYILAKSWRYTKMNNTYRGYNYRDRLGVIDYSGFDMKYIEEIAKAVDWIRLLRAEGKNWSHNPPEREELYPNMSNTKDGPYSFSSIKRRHAESIKEITLLWNVGVKNRIIAHNNGIYRYDDPKCCAENLGIRGEKIKFILDKMIDLNRSDNIMIPQKIKNNYKNWKEKTKMDFYVDFETLNTVFIDKNIDIYNSKAVHDYVFMIGVGYEEDNEFKYVSFVTKDTSMIEEKRIFEEFLHFINRKRSEHNIDPRLYHWSPAEVTMVESFCNRHNTYIDNNIEWIDLCKVFKDEPVLIKGVMGFGLKDVAKSMKRLGFIDTEWDDEIQSGFSASLLACEYYRNYNLRIIGEIERYNLIDCKVLWEILEYLRLKHI